MLVTPSLQNRASVHGASKAQSPQKLRFDTARLLWFSGRLSQQRGVALPVVLVVSLALFLGVAAIADRTSLGLFASLFQGENRAARDVGESAITDYMHTMNREENRYLLVAGDDEKSNWSDQKHRNPCTTSVRTEGGGWSQISNNLATAQADATPVSTSALKFAESATESWKPLVEGDTTREFCVEDIEYRYEKGKGLLASREAYNFSTANANIQATPAVTVRNSILQGGTRTLLRVTVQARVKRDGKEVSRSRVTREMEVVPKCCKRSFGGNTYGGFPDQGEPWGADRAACPVADSSKGGRGVIAGLAGGAPTSSGNELDIRDESNVLQTTALCWSGNESGVESDLTAQPNPKCASGELAMGASSKTKAGISFLPDTFSLTLPTPWFATLNLTTGGYSASLVPDSFGNIRPNSAVPGGLEMRSSFNELIPSGGAQPWYRSNLHDSGFKVASLAPVLACPTSQGNYTTYSGLCGLYYSPSTIEKSGSILLSTFYSGLPVLQSSGPYKGALTVTSDARIYLDPDFKEGGTLPVLPVPVAMIKIGASTPKLMDNCVVTREPSSINSKDFLVADCYFKYIDLGSKSMTVDTTHGKINFHFVELSPAAPYTGEYIKGSGNTQLVRVHCDQSTTLPGACLSPITWAVNAGGPDFQDKDTSLPIPNPYYDFSELFNIFSNGKGKLTLNGSASAVGVNVIAPYANVSLIGGGSACSNNRSEPNFMGRIWVNNLEVRGDTCIRTPTSLPAFCSTQSCPEGEGILYFDVAAKSYSHASGF